MEPKVSIIIPIYNVGAMLNHCLKSIMKQSYTSWEAICVDDGSTDKSPQIIEKYVAKDSRFKHIRQANAGLSCARNVGMDAATGKYILFIDGDDFIHRQLLEICVYQAEKYGSDLVSFYYDRTFRYLNKVRFWIGLPGRKIVYFKKKYKKEEVECLTTDNVYNHITNYQHIDIPGSDPRFYIKHCEVWKSLYRTSVIKDIKFIPKIYFEDLPWWGEVLKHIKIATINNLPLYFYYPSRTSFLMTSKAQDMINMLKLSIAEAEKLYAGPEYDGDPRREVWEERFLVPFRSMLKRKIEKYGEE